MAFSAMSGGRALPCQPFLSSIWGTPLALIVLASSTVGSVPVGAGLGESAVDVGQVVAFDDQRPAAEGVHAGGVALEVPLQFGGAALAQSV